MLFQRPYISKSYGGACPRTSLAARAFGAHDSPPTPPPPNKSNLATALLSFEHLETGRFDTNSSCEIAENFSSLQVQFASEQKKHWVNIFGTIYISNE